jgi:hypothetical protein
MSDRSFPRDLRSHISPGKKWTDGDRWIAYQPVSRLECWYRLSVVVLPALGAVEFCQSSLRDCWDVLQGCWPAGSRSELLSLGRALLPVRFRYLCGLHWQEEPCTPALESPGLEVVANLYCEC